MPKRTSRDTSYKIIVAGVDRIHRQLKPPGHGGLLEPHIAMLKQLLRDWTHDQLACLAGQVRPHVQLPKLGRPPAQSHGAARLIRDIEKGRKRAGSLKVAVGKYADKHSKSDAAIAKALQRAKRRQASFWADAVKYGRYFGPLPDELHATLAPLLRLIFPELAHLRSARARWRAAFERDRARLIHRSGIDGALRH
jgi:hypothetical protein